MARKTRIQITVSPAMTIALEVLRDRTGLSTAAQAMLVLRQALDRTITGAEVQRRLSAQRAQRTSADWNSDTTVDHVVDTVFAAYGGMTGEEEEAPKLPDAVAVAVGRRAPGEASHMAGAGLARAESARGQE